MADSPHITALRNQNKLNRLATKRFRVVSGRLEKYKVSPPLQDIEMVVAEAAVTEIKNARIGQHIYGHGVYMGQWTPKDCQGNSLRRTFNVFAAPEDLPNPMTYADTYEHVAGLKDWNGYNGTPYGLDKELYAAIREGTYNGGWFIPTRELLAGLDANNAMIQPDNLISCRDRGHFKGNIKTAASPDNDYSDYYWSCTVHPEDEEYMYTAAAFPDGRGNGDRWDNLKLSCRPVRLEPVP